MPTTQLSVARGEILRPFGFEEFATTTDLTTNNSVISTELANRWNQDDHFNGHHLLIRGTNNARTRKRITDYTGSSGTLTVSGAVLAADTGAVTCELSKYFHTDDVERAMNRVRQDCYPMLCILRDLRLATGIRQYKFTLPSTIRRIHDVFLDNRDPAQTHSENVLSNGGFDNWDSATVATSWAIAGTGATANRESSNAAPSNYAVLTDGYSARVDVPVTTAVTFLQAVTPDVAAEGMEFNLSVWVYCVIASRVAARVSGAGVVSTPVDGSTHGGTGWELLTVSGTLTSTATALSAGISVTSGAVLDCYVDEALLTLGPSEELDREWDRLYGWRHIRPVAGASNGGLLEFDGSLLPKRRIRLIGSDMLSAVTTETGTIEIDGELLAPYYARTRQYLCQERANQLNEGPEGEWRNKAKDWAKEYKDLLDNGHRVSLPVGRIRGAYG